MLELRAKKKTNNRPGERPHSDSKSEPNVGDENAQCRCLTFGSEDSAQLQTRSHVEQVEGLDDSTRVAQKTSVTPATACERLSVRRSFRRSFFSPPNPIRFGRFRFRSQRPVVDLERAPRPLKRPTSFAYHPPALRCRK